jgi:hypothetical protein
MDVAEVDQDVAYVVMVLHLCCKRLFSNVLSVFQTYVANVFIWILHMFHIYVASVLSGCCVCVAMDFQVFLLVFVSV